MASLRRELRKELEHAVTAARSAAEKGARKAIEAFAVQNGKPWPSMSEEQKQLRSRLRAHGRQLGDRRELKSGNQSIDHIVQECAYEHWHRMLFARFLAENDLLIEPESGVAISLDECRELALERGVDWLTLASEFAVKMLSQIFRAGDPVLEVSLPPETRQELEGLMKTLPREVFLADDSMGWVYQFWQAEKKDEVNASGEKIGADELAAVTQLFTEDYMVLFLLHNTLGAWWTGKVLAQQPDLATTAKSEDELRAACAIGDLSWEYLRFVRDGEGAWRPAAGTFDGWPKDAKDLKVLDPCMGSGHFLVFALPMLVALRMAEEKLAREDAIEAILRDNLFGLELDNRCTQIAAFNLALTAWRMSGHRQLPPPNLACSGLGINAKEEEWVELAGKDQSLRDGMADLYALFKKGPVLGSLINPRALNKTAPLLAAEFHDLQPLLQAALRREEGQNYEVAEMAIAAQGMAKAGEILAGDFTLVATNVPYLGRGKQVDELKDYCGSIYPEAKADLSTCFVERCLGFCAPSGTTVLVTPQNWFFLGTYKKLRQQMFREAEWNLVVKLGPAAFQNMNFWAAKTALCALSRRAADGSALIVGFDVSETRDPSVKATLLLTSPACVVRQLAQLNNPDARLLLSEMDNLPLLEIHGTAFQGIATADYPRFGRCFWELPRRSQEWQFQQSTVEMTSYFSGREHIFLWEDGKGSLAASEQARIQGLEAVGKFGIAVSQMNQLPVTLFTGEFFDNNCSALAVREKALLPAVWAYCASGQFLADVREIDQAVKVTNASLVKVPFDLAHWQTVAAEKYPHGLPKPHSNDPTQWLFNGNPKGSDQPLHVAVARLLGYQWPRQTGSSFPDCPALGADVLEKLAATDGIVCIDPSQGELSAAERLRALLAAAYGAEWSPAKQAELVGQVEATSLDQWLREDFFEQHCGLFHNRPFIWHIWDGMKNGFHALVNYHKLAAPNGVGRRTLERLIYSYLGDWIKQQRDDQKNGVEGADARVAAAEHLKKQLELILHGEPPYDIFVRWKPLHQQPIGWEPDINDGVRPNIRPFMTATPLNPRGKSACILRVTPKIKWEKDRGKEPKRAKADFPWFWGWDKASEDQRAGKEPFLGTGKEPDGNRWNDLHYSTSFKQATRDRNSGNKKKEKR
jgi:hypothetical protein